MTARNRFLLLFAAFQVVLCAVVSVVSIIFILQTVNVLVGASHNPILTAMKNRVLSKSVISLAFLSLCIMAAAIPAALALYRITAAPYLQVLQRFTTLARQRLSDDTGASLDKSERRLLAGCASVLITDMEKIRDYDKLNSWKDGARMLIHELKNPLTPLKLSAQQLQVSLPPDSSGEIGRLNRSLEDIERILDIFKNLVNVEFGRKETLDACTLLDDVAGEVTDDGTLLTVRRNVRSRSLPVLSEKTLVKMLFINLIKNSREENPGGCEVVISENDIGIHVEVITRERTIETPERVFRAGYSSKGSGRGYGLFLSKMISNYLDMDLRCENRSGDAVFSVDFKRIDVPSTETR
jgi:signal transduction histidine kinase